MDKSPYGQHFNDNDFWNKLKNVAKDAGLKVIYSGLLLYYALENPKTPLKAKIQIYGALGYLILPTDLVADLLPFVGYVDDLGALALAISAVSNRIDDDVRRKAKAKLQQLFGEDVSNHKDIIDVEAQITDDKQAKIKDGES